MKPNKQAFTLIELLVVVLIIGILATVALPQYQKAVLKSRFSTLKNLTKALANAEEVYYLNNSDYTPDISKLDIDVPTPNSSSLSDNFGSHFYSWGHCTLEVRPPTRLAVYCVLEDDKNNNILGYLIELQHSNATEKVKCYAYPTDTTSLPHSICKAETGQSTPTSNIVYVYQ